MKISFREINDKDAQMILDWRTLPDIAKNMVTDIPYDISAQKKWIKASYGRDNYYHWIILCDDTPAGCIYIQDFDFKNKFTSWGFYKGISGFPGAGRLVVPFFYNWLFLKVGILNIFTEVIHYNIKALDLYLSYGHKLVPEKNRVISKNGREVLLIALSLSSQDWDEEAFKDSITSFPTYYWKNAPF